MYQFSSVQSLSCVQLFVTPCIPARQASLSITNSQRTSSKGARSAPSPRPLGGCRVGQAPELPVLGLGGTLGPHGPKAPFQCQDGRGGGSWGCARRLFGIIKIYKYIKHKYIKQIQCYMPIISQFLKKLDMNGTKKKSKPTTFDVVD